MAVNFNQLDGGLGGGRTKQLTNFKNYVKDELAMNVDEDTAYKKYRAFKAGFSLSKVGRFFDANKDLEWFRLKYHPLENQHFLKQQNVTFLKRLKIFNDLNDRNIFDSFSYTKNNQPYILNLMDAVIVQLEDGPQELVEQLLSRDDSKINFQLKQEYVPIQPTSIVIDDIPIETTLAQIKDVCSRADPNILRIAQLDPYYVEGGDLKRKFLVIYKSSVAIRDVCWKLSRAKLNNRPFNVYINKCLTNRVHPVDAISNHHLSIVNDIRNAIVLILNFDELRGLYGKRKQLLENSLKNYSSSNNIVKMEFQDSTTEQQIESIAPLSPPGSEKSVVKEDGEKPPPFDFNTLDEDREIEKKKLFEFKFKTNLTLHKIIKKINKSKNPILEGALIYLVEHIESSAAKYYLSKVPARFQPEPETIDLDLNGKDMFSTLSLIIKYLPCTLEESTKFLDRLLWYLRIVHSFDYYKKFVYKQEDELTLRLGVIHVRDDPSNLSPEVSEGQIRQYLSKSANELEEFAQSLHQKYVTSDEERYNYKSYGKVITEELASYSQKITKAVDDTEEPANPAQKKQKSKLIYVQVEVFKCKHCSKVFQKLVDLGRHFVSKHRWDVDAIELEIDFSNNYLFDPNKIDPCPPKELLDVRPNRFARINNFNFNQPDEEPDLLQQMEAYTKLKSIPRVEAPRSQVESDPRNDSIVDYADISFDDAI